MIYPPLSLSTAGSLTGILLIAFHGLAFFGKETATPLLKSFPRSKPAGALLLVIAALWAFALVWTMDLGEFSPFRNMLEIAVVAGGFLAIRYSDEFLAVRAAGMLLLLAAEVLLEAAFLRPEAWRLLLVILAYGWVIAGLFWVGMPYLLRDQIDWVTRTATRWRLCCAGGALYGAALVISSLIRCR
jgi:hypothetical protein